MSRVVDRFVQKSGMVLGWRGVRWQEGERGRLWRRSKEIERFLIAILGGLVDIFLKRKALSVLMVAQ